MANNKPAGARTRAGRAAPAPGRKAGAKRPARTRVIPAQAARAKPAATPIVERLLQQHHEMVYYFPLKVMGAPEEECADFYCYAMEQITKREILSAQKYVEREGARFETWLAVVLRNLYIDLKRSQHRPRVDLSDCLEMTAATPDAPPAPGDPEALAAAEQALKLIKPECRVLFKLLLLNDLYLDDGDLKVIAKRSGRSVPEVLEVLRELETQVGGRSRREKDRQEELTRVFWWVEYYRGRVEYLRQVHGDDPAAWTPKARALIREAQRKLGKRRKQHAELVRQYRAAGLTVKTSYEMIAKILNTTRDAVKMEAYRCRCAYLQAVASLKGANAKGTPRQQYAGAPQMTS